MDNITNIIISNCNCIKEASIEIEHGALNIKYGYNGVGKSTISKAILAKASNEENELKNLLPYGNNPNSMDESPNVENLNFSKVSVFNEDYIRSYIFKDNNILEDSYKVFLKTEEKDQLILEIEQLMSDLHGVFNSSEEFQNLQEFLPKYFAAVNYRDGKVSDRGGVRDFVRGNGSGFEKYEELDRYKPFYENVNLGAVSKWAKWRIDGMAQMNGTNCPFCISDLDNEVMEEENKTFTKVVKNSALSSANNIFKYVEGAVEIGYIEESSIDFLKEYIGDGNKEDVLYAELQQLAVETEYLYNKINIIKNFKPMVVNEEQLNNIEDSLDRMLIEPRQLSKFYSTLTIEMLVDASI